MKLSPSIQGLIDGLRHLPGVGPKSAQRMTLHLLERDREGAQEIANESKRRQHASHTVRSGPPVRGVDWCCARARVRSPENRACQRADHAVPASAAAPHR